LKVYQKIQDWFKTAATVVAGCGLLLLGMFLIEFFYGSLAYIFVSFFNLLWLIPQFFVGLFSG